MQQSLRFSVIIPTFNRSKSLKNCLQALSDQTWPVHDFEVIVVDDGSTVSPKDVIGPFLNRLCLCLLRQPHSGPAAARNLGAQRARGRFLAFTDDDCTPHPHWLAAFSEVFEAAPGALVGGSIVCSDPCNLYGSASQMILDRAYAFYNQDAHRAQFFSACNMALPASCFQNLGGFNATFHAAEDREFCNRWLITGAPMLYRAHALVQHHDGVIHLLGFAKRYVHYGRGAFRFHRLRKLCGSGSMSKEMALHANIGQWLRYPFFLARGTRALRLSLLLLVWQVCNALGFLAEWLVYRPQQQGAHWLSGDIS